jgi:outer membrane protein assembly factor BamB
VRAWLPTAATLAAALAAAALLRAWIAARPPLPAVRAPTAEGSLAEAYRAGLSATPSAVRAGTVDLSGVFRAFPGAPAPRPSADWPCFRGPRRDNIAPDDPALAVAWPTNGPPVLWTTAMGEGHAAAAVRAGRVYVLDYDEARGGDRLRCLDLATGDPVWERFYAIRHKRNHGISRTIPAVSDDGIVTVGPQCHVLCVAAADGAFRWGMDLVRQYDMKDAPLWYTGQCPLLDNGEVVLAPGSKALMIGVEVASGRVKWETPNPDQWRMSHASIMTMTVDGLRQFVYPAAGGVAGVAADGPERGRLLWTTTAFAPSVVAPSAVPLPDGRFFLTAGYGAGGAMLRVARSNGAWRADVLFRTDRRTFACEQQTPVLRDGLLYGVLPADAGDHRGEFVCLAPDGARRWTSGAENRFGLGPFLGVGPQRFLLLSDKGVLTFAQADAGGFRVLARADVMGGQGRDAWGPLALVDGRLLLRDLTRMWCLDLRAK